MREGPTPPAAEPENEPSAMSVASPVHPRGADGTRPMRRIQEYRQMRAAEKAAAEAATSRPNGDKQVRLVDVSTTQEHHQYKADELKLRVMLATGKPNEVVEHCKAMYINKKDLKSYGLAMIEEAKEMEAELDNIIRQGDGDTGVQETRDSHADFLKTFAAFGAPAKKPKSEALAMIEEANEFQAQWNSLFRQGGGETGVEETRDDDDDLFKTFRAFGALVQKNTNLGLEVLVPSAKTGASPVAPTAPLEDSAPSCHLSTEVENPRPDSTAEIEAFQKTSRDTQMESLSESSLHLGNREHRLESELERIRGDRDALYDKLIAERNRSNLIVRAQMEQISERDEEIACLRRRLKRLEGQ